MTFRLDAGRNRLLKVEVAATAVGTAMGIGSVMTGVFGMNLQTPLFTSVAFRDGQAFNLAVPAIAFICALVSCSMIGFLYCPKRRLRAEVGSLCCCLFCKPRRRSILPRLPSQEDTLRRLFKPDGREEGDYSFSGNSELDLELGHEATNAFVEKAEAQRCEARSCVRVLTFTPRSH